MLFAGKIYRRNRTERDWHGWTDLYMFLFDNYLVITREETRSGGDPKEEEDKRFAVVSRVRSVILCSFPPYSGKQCTDSFLVPGFLQPIPLEFLQLVGKEDDEGEKRRDMVVSFELLVSISLLVLITPSSRQQLDYQRTKPMKVSTLLEPITQPDVRHLSRPRPVLFSN